MKEKAVITEKWGSKWLFTHNAKTLTALIMDFQASRIPAKILAMKESFEVGEAGNLHKHVYVSLNRSIRFSTLLKKFPQTDIKAITPGTEQTVIEYVGNSDKTASKGCQIISVSEYGNLDTSQGTRTDLNETDSKLWQIKDAIDNGANLRSIWNDFFPQMVRFGGGIKTYAEILKEAEKDVIVRSKEEMDYINAEKEKEILDKIALSNFEQGNVNYMCDTCHKPLFWDKQTAAYICEVHGVLNSF